MDKIILIPAYQPSDELLKIISELKKYDLDLIVVNDGSEDKYQSVFNQIKDNATLLVHSHNKGKGAALKTGFDYIKNKYDSDYIVVTADADGQHRTSDIIKICEESKKYPNSLILGSRKLNKNVPLRSRFGNSITRLVFKLSTGTKIYDTQTGLRAFTNILMDKMISIDGNRYEYEMNVLMNLASDKINIREMWIETVYLNDNQSSHFDTIKDSYRIYKEIIKFSSSSLLSFGIDYIFYCIFSILTGSIYFSNIAARIISGTTNYLMNKKFVFNHQEKVFISALKYFILAVFILICNTIILKLFVSIGINKYLAKIITEIILFSFSWFVQHTFIFKKEKINQ